MDLWIRSQDKELLVLAKGFEFQKLYDDRFQIFAVWQNNYQMVGVYKSKQRALEVLNEIEERICLLQTIELATGNQTMMKAYQIAMGDDKIKGIGYPYQMPIE